MHGVLIPVIGILMQTTPIVAAGLLGVLDTVWPYVLMLAGFSLIVFVHELGHFSVAKWAGVKVDRFAIGFGREVIGFTKGETRYSFNILPLGGYVKMMGQEDFDDKSNELKFNDDPRSFANKPVGHRMAVVSAGVVMNILFAALLFMIVFLIGMEGLAPRIGIVDPDSPADKAGLLPGDMIKQINGEHVLEFSEVRAAILLAPKHEPIEFIVERNGEALPPISIVPEYRDPESVRDIRRQVVGITEGVTRTILAVGPEIDPNRPDHPKPGDVLVEVNGVAITDDNASQVLNTLVYGKGEVWVERKDATNPSAASQRVKIEIPPRIAFYPEITADPTTATLLGLAPLASVMSVGDGGRAYYAGIEPGDVILMFDDVMFPTIAQVSAAIVDNAERDIPFRVRHRNGREIEGFVRPSTNKKGPATIQALWTSAAASEGQPKDRVVLSSVRSGGIAAKAGLESGDIVLEVNGMKSPTTKEFSEAIRRRARGTVPIEVRKADGRVHRTTVVPQYPGTIAADPTLVANEALIVADVVATQAGRPSPAAVAGIPRGSMIKTVNGRAMTTWMQFIEAMQMLAGGTVEIGYRVAGEKEDKVAQFAVPHTLYTKLGIRPEGRILSMDGRETVTIGVGSSAQTVPVGYREGMKAIVAELAGKTVEVVYRENPLAAKKSAQVELTAEMADPWVSRIAFAPSVLPSPHMVMLRGENMFDAIWIGMHKTYYFILQVYTFLERMIFSRSLGLESMSGPLGIFDMGGQVARADLVKFLYFLAMISANLAVINFLPLPIFDGGLMVFLLIEKIKGSPVSLRVQVATQMIGFFLIIGAFLFVTYQDALRLLG